MHRADTETYSTPATDDTDDASDASVVSLSLVPLLLTIRHVGVVVGISERKLRAMVSAGQFPKPVRGLGRMSRWKRSAVEGWVASL